MKDIRGYEGLYAITEDGQVWSHRRKRFLKPSKNKQGYLRVGLTKDGKQKNFFIHRLVLETYCPVENMENLTVDHYDFNIENNNLLNLRWLDLKENSIRHNQNSRNNCKTVVCIDTNQIYCSTREASRQTGIAQQSISACCRGKLKTAGGYHWEFV